MVQKSLDLNSGAHKLILSFLPLLCFALSAFEKKEEGKKKCAFCRPARLTT